MDRREAMRLLAGGAAAALAGCGPAYYGAPPPGPRPRPVGYYEYYYYPYADVYFHVYTGYYYYVVGGTWHRARALPPRYVLDPRYRVQLTIRDDRPYVHHSDHRRAHPPPPQFRPDPRRDRDERQRNLRIYEDYQKRRRP